MNKVSGTTFGTLAGYDELENGDQFIYTQGASVEFVGIKIDTSKALFLNARNKFIEAKRYTNILSIGDYSIEYDSVADYMTHEEERKK